MSQVVGEDLMVGMGYIGLDSGRLYRMRRGPKLIEAVASGTTVIINDATEGRPFRGLRVFGKSTQVKTTGAQLFDVTDVEMKAVLKMDGTTSSNSNIHTSGFIKVLPNETYSVSSTRQNRGKFYDINKRVLTTDKFDFELANSKDKFTASEKTEYVRFSIYETESLDNVMVNAGDTLKPWEPYTGGKPSPSPEYPQEIVSAGESGNITVEVGGKNLLKPNSYNTYYEFPLKANTVITLMTNGKPSQGGNIKFSATDGSNVWFSIDAGQTRVCRSIGNKDVKGFYDQLKVGGGLEYMLAVGDIKTYTPYVEPQSLTLQTPNGLPGVPVSKDGNYTDADGQQWVCDEVDLGRGKYVQRIKKSLVSLEKISYDNADGYRYISYGITDAHRNHTEILSDKFRYNKDAANSLDGITNRGIRVAPDYDAIVAFEKSVLPSELIETTVYYVLDTPIERDLTPEEIAAYKALRTYGPTTVVSNDAGAEMEITYRKDKKNEKIHWNKVD